MLHVYFCINFFYKRKANHSAAAVMVLGALVRKDSQAVLSQLPRLVETVVKSLDPHSPSLRDACLKASTAVLHVMVTVHKILINIKIIIIKFIEISNGFISSRITEDGSGNRR